MIENVELESLEGLERKLKVEVSAVEVGSAYDKRLTTVASTMELKGFRKGKVPKSVIESRYSEALCQEVANELVQAALPKAIDEKKLKLVGQPHIDAEPLRKGDQFVFTAVFEVYPDIEVNDLAGVDVEKNVSSIEQADLDDMMQQIRKQQAEWKEVERASQDGDRLKIDFEGFINDVAFDGGKAENFELILGSKKMVPGFEDGLLNQAVGATTDLQVTFPDDYQPKDLAAKAAVFKVKVHEVAEPILPELNDELAKKMGVEDGVEALQNKVKDNLQRELDTRLRNKFKSVLLDSLLSRNELEVPKALVDSEISHMRKMHNQQLAAMQGQNSLPDVDIPDEHFHDEALKRVKLGLLLSEVIQKNDIKLDQDKVTARIEDMASAYPQKEQIINYYRNNKQMLAQIEAAVMEDQALEILADSANIKEVSLSYKQVMDEK